MSMPVHPCSRPRQAPRAQRALLFWLAPRLAMALMCLLILPACLNFGREPLRHYYVLNTERQPTGGRALFPGLVRVRDLDAESAYDRFQLVMRKSPFELSYRQRDVWAVKPNRMLADIIASTLVADNVFAGVTRELSERRPQFLLSGELHAIEVIDQGREGWAVHLAMSLTLSHFGTGATLWSYRFDQTEGTAQRDFASCIETLSSLTAIAMTQATTALRQMPRTADADGMATPPDGAALPAPASHLAPAPGPTGLRAAP